jgi:hypothetical protein
MINLNKFRNLGIGVGILAILVLGYYGANELDRNGEALSTMKTSDDEYQSILIEDLTSDIFARKSIKELAQTKLKDLMETNNWSHTNSDGCDYNCRTNGYTEDGKYSWVGENLYRGICNSENAYSLWKLSPTHNEILLHEYDEQILISGKWEDGTCYMVLEKGVLR